MIERSSYAIACKFTSLYYIIYEHIKKPEQAVTEGMMKMSLIELEQAVLELRGLEKDIRELGDSL